MIDVSKVRQSVLTVLTQGGWKADSAAGTNFVNPGRDLQFKVGTVRGEVTVHVRNGHETVETIRIISPLAVRSTLDRLNQMMVDSDMEAALPTQESLF